MLLTVCITVSLTVSAVVDTIPIEMEALRRTRKERESG